MKYLSPSFLYPAAFAYQLAIGFIHRLSSGRLMMKLVRAELVIVNGPNRKLPGAIN